jgi:predicted nicotinamide N-methyase
MRTYLQAQGMCETSSVQRARRGCRVLELGSGCGLVAIALGLRGCIVTATDKLDVLTTLQANVDGFLSLYQTMDTVRPSIQVREYDWGTAYEHSTQNSEYEGCTVASLGTAKFDFIVCADCVYASASVEPLLRTITQVSVCALQKLR